MTVIATSHSSSPAAADERRRLGLRGGLRGALAELASAAIAFAAVGGIAAENGGYFPTTWGWAAVGLLGVAALAILVAGPPRPGRLELAALGAVVAVSAWTFASSLWSDSVTRSMLEGERSLVYAGVVAVALVVDRRSGGRAVVTGTWLAITAVCVYALLTRLFPGHFGVTDEFGQGRLSAPVGYWNGLGLLATVGLLLAAGLVARGGAPVRVAAAASSVALATTLYFTFSRGAWIALMAGAIAAIVLDRRRLQLVAAVAVAAPGAAIGVYAASRAHALTHRDAAISAAESDGHALAVILLGLATLAALSALAFDVVQGRWQPRPALRRAFAVVLVCGALIALGLVFARVGSPGTIARRAWHSFNSGATGGSNLNNRLFQLSSNGRVKQWRVAWHEYRGNPWLGSGAGTFAEYWFAHRPEDSGGVVHDAHNLYLETLAETGPAGLAFLGVLLLAPLAGAARSRSPFGGVAAAAVAAFALHSAVDWDWELPVLLATVLLPALAVQGERPRIAARRARLAPAAVVLAAGAFALVGMLGNIALVRSGNASDATHWRQAEREARSAIDLAPWSAEPWRKLAVAQVGLGEIASARQSLLEAVRMEPGDWSLWYQLAEVSTGRLHRRAAAEATRLNPRVTSAEATPGDLRLVVIP